MITNPYTYPVTESISNNKGEVTLQLSSSIAPIPNSYRYEYREVNGGYEVDIFYDNKLIVTQLFDSKNIEVNENGYVYSGLEAVKKMVESNERLGLYEFDENGKLINEGIGEFRYPKSPIPTSPPLPIITISAPGYETIEKIPYKGDGTVKEDLGVIQMTPIEEATEADKIEASQFNSQTLEELTPTSKKTPEYFAQKKLTDLVINLKGTALPLAITLIAQFGITKAAQLIDQKKAGKNKTPIYSYKNNPLNLKDKVSCPSESEILNLISRKNKLVKQINNSLKIIEGATKILGITEGVIVTLDIAFRLLKNLPLPSSVPPGVGLPLNAILGVQDSKDTISKTITKLKTANTGLLTILVIIRQTLTQLLQYLSLLDTLIQQCSPNNELAQETISRDLVSLTQDQSSESPVVTNVNGFKIDVETENTTNSLKRRRAIAQNKQGVIMLKGEWSFSSIDQILIDELVFYIQQNNLKAD